MDFEKQHRKNVEIYKAKVNEIYDKAIKKIASLGISLEVEEGNDFQWQDYPQAQDRLKRITNKLGKELEANVMSGIEIEWELANQKNDELATAKVGDKEDLDIQLQEQYFGRNEDGLKAFIERDNAGMNLSERVWKLCDEFKIDTELGMSAVLRDGLKQRNSAEELQRKVRQYLNEPNRIFRRHLNKKTGKMELSKAAKNYHPGRGVYRSSRKNALRMTATETNMAFRASDHERVKKFDFVLGVKVVCSNNHPVKDICDDLAGVYPKDFKFTGWHPWCRCHTETVLKSDADMRKERKARREALLNGQPIPQPDQSKEVTEVPGNFREWVNNNQDKIAIAEEKGKLPYFLKDNMWAITSNKAPISKPKILTQEEIIANRRTEILANAKERHRARTQAEIDDIKNRWKQRNELLEKEQKRKEILEKAKVRHEARTQKQIDAIKLKWQKHNEKIKQLTDEAKAIINDASDYSNVDTTVIESMLNNNKFNQIGKEIKKAVKQLNAIKEKEVALSDIIPDVHEWSKQFTFEQLDEVHEVVSKKLASWESLPLFKQKDKLKFEAIDYLGGNMNNVQSKYSTWKVSQSAYLKKLDEVTNTIEWNEVNILSTELIKFKTKSSIYISNCENLKVAMMNKDLASAKSYISILTNKKIELETAKTKRKASKLKVKPVNFFEKLTDDEFRKKALELSKLRKWKSLEAKIPNLTREEIEKELLKKGEDLNNPYSQARKDVAIKYSEGMDAYRKLSPDASKIWKGLDEEEKNGLYVYTKEFCNTNEPLRGQTYIGDPIKTKEGVDKVAPMTSAIEKTSLVDDMWVRRGDNVISLKQFGLSNWGSATDKDFLSMKGKEGVMGAFISAGTTMNTGFTSKPIVYRIYCPKGTKGMYAEPFSFYGDGARSPKWDGTINQTSTSSENEIILQRGSKYRITDVQYLPFTNDRGTKEMKWCFDLEIIEQTPVEFPYVGGYPFL